MFERARNHNIRKRAGDLAGRRMLPDVLFANEISSEKKYRKPGKFRVVNVVELEAIRRERWKAFTIDSTVRNFILTATERALYTSSHCSINNIHRTMDCFRGVLMRLL